MTPSEKTSLLRRLAAEIGFDRARVASATKLDRDGYLRGWLDRGFHGKMEYLERYYEQRADPRVLLDGAKSVIVVALNYHQSPPPKPDDQPRGQVAMYAWGDDYHKLMKRRLFLLADRLHEAIDQPFETKCCVDTAPILEREWAARAGVGWIGKNTLVLNQGLGSYFFLGEIVSTLEFAADQEATDHCGSCTRCLEACPTEAFPAPYQMDASRCISYLTIEHRDPIPPEFHQPMGDWLFGCDICQQVCPFNRDVPEAEAFATRPPGPFPVLYELENFSQEQYRTTLTNSAMKRAKLPMLQRNAAIARSNLKKPH